MKIYILASGSKGNAVIIENANKYLQIDLGISNKRYLEKLASLSISPELITDLIITHEHKDHIDGSYIFLKNHPNTKAYLTNGTLKGSLFHAKGITNYEIISPDQELSIGNYKIATISTSHDAREPIGLVINIAGKKIIYITDTGYINSKYDEILSNADLYLVEANHDISHVMNTPKRPYNTKLRIISDHGHMDNEYISKKINQYMSDNKKVLWAIMHISEDCNTKDSIERSICNNISNLDNLEIIYTSQETSEITLKED